MAQALLPWTLEDVEAELARRSLAEFVRQAWHVIEPGTPLVWGWAVEVICDHVQALVEDRLGKNNLDINVPPGSMKSTIVSVCLPAWRWIDHPHWRVVCSSGSDGIAQRDQLLQGSWSPPGIKGIPRSGPQRARTSTSSRTAEAGAGHPIGPASVSAVMHRADVPAARRRPLEGQAGPHHHRGTRPP